MTYRKINTSNVTPEFDFEQIQGLKIKIFLLILYIGKDKCFFFITSFQIEDGFFIFCRS